MAAGIWSLLFTWGFGSFLLARNWKALGNDARANRCMIWFYSVFLHPILGFLAPSTPSVAIAFLFADLVVLAVWAIVEMRPQITFIADRFGNEYLRRPWGKPIGIWIACVTVLVGFAMAVKGGSTEHGFGQDLVFNNGHVFYLPPVTESEAKRLGTFLVANNVFNGDDKAVQIRKIGNTYQYRMVLKEGIAPDLAVKLLRPQIHFRRSMSTEVFNNAPVEEHLCDNAFNTLRVIPPLAPSSDE